jgi:hypothetical protein
MQLTPNEIQSVEDIGMMNGKPVKMIKTKGGFHICVGHARGKIADEALAAGSHPAIVKYNLERQYPEFQPNMMKSELIAGPTRVEKHSHFLSDELRKSGHDIYSVQSIGGIEFQITKHNSKIASVFSSFDNGNIIFNELKIGREFSRALAGATAEKALACGAKKIKIQAK